jgi:glucose dehydrogenase
VFLGLTSDARFRALDSRTGKELRFTKLPAQRHANPMTYQANNRRTVRGDRVRGDAQRFFQHHM